jgi:cyanophycinase
MSVLLTFAFLVLWIPAQSPAGHLVLDGGGRSLPEIRQHAIELAGGPNARMLLVPHAAGDHADPDLAEIIEFWRGQGVKSVDVLDLTDRERAIDQINRADFIWMTGGNQVRLVEELQKAKVVDALRARFQKGAVVGGTSAGAAAASTVMIGGYLGRRDTPEGRRPLLLPGLGLWPEAIVDQHFRQRDRALRLKSAVADHPALVGVGIDESTAIIVSGNRLTVIGKGEVSVLDPRKVTRPSLETANGGGETGPKDAKSESAEPAVTILRGGSEFDFATGKLVSKTPATVP